MSIARRARARAAIGRKIARIVVVLGLLVLVVGTLAAAQVQPLPQTVLSTPVIDGIRYQCKVVNVGSTTLTASVKIRNAVSGEDITNEESPFFGCGFPIAPGHGCSASANRPIPGIGVYCQISFIGFAGSVRGDLVSIGSDGFPELVVDAR